MSNKLKILIASILGIGATGGGMLGYTNMQSNVPSNLTTANFATTTVSQWVNNANYVTSTLPLAVNQTYSGIAITLAAGEDLLAGDVVYIKSDGKAWKADANAVTTTPAIGMAVANISSTTAAGGVILLHGIIYNARYSAMPVGAVVYVSTVAGEATTTQPSATNDLIQSIGIGYGGTIFFNPDLIFLNRI